MRLSFSRRRQPCTRRRCADERISSGRRLITARPGPTGLPGAGHGRQRAQVAAEKIRIAIRETAADLRVGAAPRTAWRAPAGAVPAGVGAIRRPTLCPSESAVTTTRPRRSNGLSAAVSVVRSMASSDATDAIPAGFGRFSDIMSENLPVGQPSGRRTPRRNGARSARAACWTWRQRHVSRTRSVVFRRRTVSAFDMNRIMLISTYHVKALGRLEVSARPTAGSRGNAALIDLGRGVPERRSRMRERERTTARHFSERNMVVGRRTVAFVGLFSSYSSLRRDTQDEPPMGMADKPLCADIFAPRLELASPNFRTRPGRVLCSRQSPDQRRRQARREGNEASDFGSMARVEPGDGERPGRNPTRPTTWA